MSPNIGVFPIFLLLFFGFEDCTATLLFDQMLFPTKTGLEAMAMAAGVNLELLSNPACFWEEIRLGSTSYWVWSIGLVDIRLVGLHVDEVVVILSLERL